MINSNGEEVADWFEDELGDLEDDVDSLPEEAARRTLDRATDEVPVRTGDLRNSLTQAEGEVYSTLDYAPHVGLGTIYMEGTDYLWGPAQEELEKLLTEIAEA